MIASFSALYNQKSTCLLMIAPFSALFNQKTLSGLLAASVGSVLVTCSAPVALMVVRLAFFRSMSPKLDRKNVATLCIITPRGSPTASVADFSPQSS